MSKRVKTLLIASAVAFSMPAFAECYYSSQTIAQIPYKIDDIDSVNTMRGPGHCTVTARVLYKNQWHSIAGKAADPNKDQEAICMDALTYSIKDFLLRANGQRVDAVQQMICTDLPTTKLKPVDRGDIVKASEVTPHPTRQPFLNNGNECRWFIETEVDEIKRMKTINGIICRVGRLTADQWYVVGKRFD